MDKKKTMIVSILGIISLILITVGITYAFFSYTREGSTENTVTSGSITFLYTEVDGIGRGINITNAFPTEDEAGKKLTGTGNVFNFKVTSKVTGNFDIPYTVTARKKTTSDLPEEAVRIYLTEEIGSVEKELLLDNYDNLGNYVNAPDGVVEKVIYQGLVPTGSSNYEKNFNVRMWMDAGIEYDQEGQSGQLYSGKSFTLTVNVYANAKVVTDSDIDMANTTAINSLTVNGSEVAAIEADYYQEVENGVTEARIEVETLNEEALVEVTAQDGTVAYSSNVKRLSTVGLVTFQLEEGDNLYTVKVTSANKKNTKEYTLNVYRQLSCPYSEGDIVDTFSHTGSPEEFIVACSGTYKLELWGASGINLLNQNNSKPGLGAYTSGNINLNKGAELYFYVGNQLQYSYLNNVATIDQNYFNRGATDIRLTNGDWYSFDSLKSRIMVAASGGSVEGYGNTITAGGAGGGLTGYIGTSYSSQSDTVVRYPSSSTQTSGGIIGATTANSVGYGGSFGMNTKNYNAGNGYYSGASGGGDGYFTTFANGGGSSFISGHNGCNAVAESSTENSIIHTGQANHYSNYVFTNTVMIDGVGYNWTNTKGQYVGMPSHDGSSIISGNSGNGYAKITYLGDS